MTTRKKIDVLVCPKCASDTTKIINTKKNGATTVRVRLCSDCGFSFQTDEKPRLIPISEDEVKNYQKYVEES